MQTHLIRLESYAVIDERAHITGVALIPRISRNNNLYTKQELKRFDKVKVPLNWEHDRTKQIGFVTFHYNEEMETVYYDGFITDEASAQLARNKTLFTSIEAEPVSMKNVCNGEGDCFHMPFGLVPQALALTETPGVPETTVKVIERYVKECQVDHDLEAAMEDKHGKCTPTDIILNRCDPHENKHTDDCISKKIGIIKDEHPDMKQDQAVAIAHSKCDERHVESILQRLDILESMFCPHCGEVKKKNNLI